MNLFKDMVVVVSGAESAIGKPMVRAFVNQGAVVHLVGKNGEMINELAEEIHSGGGKCHPHTVDIRNEKEVDRLGQELKSLDGGVDVLVNAASIFRIGSVHETSVEDFRNMFETNVTGLWLLSKACIPLMKGRPNTSIVHISSTAGEETFSGMGVYESSKAAVNVLTKVMAKELGSEKIRVNAIAPGPVDTSLFQASPFGEENIFHKTEVSEVPPFGRTGTVEEIARIALFLTSPESDFISGSIIAIDGTVGY